MYLRQFLVEGLGHLSALLADERRGVAAVVDPRRDIDVYIAAAAERDLRITHVFETHLHNDYVSGARELADITGAQHVMSKAADLAYEHRPTTDDDRFDVGALRFHALATPGHTPEHISYVVSDLARGEETALVFSGGSLLINAVGRTDLLGAANAEPYARQMFHSLHDRLLTEPDHALLLPTHGGGSLCSKDIAAATISTVGYERRHSPLLSIEDVDLFVRALLTDQPAYPRYFARMRPINQAGPAPIGQIFQPPALSVEGAAGAVRHGAAVVDLRSPAEFAAGHLPDAYSIAAGATFGTWLGWIVPFGQPLVLVVPDVDVLDDALRQALRIGFDDVIGYLPGGVDAWRAAGRPVEASRAASVHELAAMLETSGRDAGLPLLLDVRQDDEYRRSHVPGAIHLMAGELPDRLAELPRDRPIVTMCSVGFRSSIAASLLRRNGFTNVIQVDGGLPEWRAAGYPIERG